MADRAQGKTKSNAFPPPFVVQSPELKLDRLNKGAAAVRSTADQIDFARAFGFRTAAAWWQALTSKARHTQPLRELFPPIDLVELAAEDGRLADQRGNALAAFDADTAAHQIGLAYTSMLPREHRSAHGIYYTPP